MKKSILNCMLFMILLSACSLNINDINSKVSNKSSSDNIKESLYKNGDVVIKDSIKYEFNKNEFSVIGYDGEIVDISILSNISNYQVTSIDYMAFAHCKSLKSIVIPEGVTNIGANSFSGCSSLTKISLPNTLTNIETFAFVESDNLIFNEYKNGKYLGNEENPYVVLIEVIDNLNCNTFEIPDETKIIYDYAFYWCVNLTNISLPEGVKSIGGLAFKDCYGLKSVVIPNTLINVKYNAFSGCIDLNFNEYKNGKYLGNEENPYVVLVEITNKENITFLEISNKIKIVYNDVFSGCSKLTNIVIPNSITSIGDYAFSGCSSLRSISLSDSLKYIGSYAFEECNNLSEINIPNSVTSIGSGAFHNCSSLKSIIIPEGVKILKIFTFYNCSSLTSVALPSTITNIYTCSFDGCISLKNIVIPNSVTYIERNAFYGASNLIIYCESASKKEGWEEGWDCYNFDGMNNVELRYCPVYFAEEWEYINGVPTPINKQ